MNTTPAFEAHAVEAHAFETKGIRLGYDGLDVFSALDLVINKGEVTTLIGANGCGKSTLLKALGRLITPKNGEILLNGLPILKQNTKTVARQVALLPQKPLTPTATTVRELVARGRYPHQSLWKAHSAQDEAEVSNALAATGISDLAERDVAALSGGQLQRVWIALVLAQKTDSILLDEPTTYLDLTHQLDVLRLVRSINTTRNATVVMVLHDLNLAARYSDRLIALAGGHIVADGKPWDVLTPRVLKQAFSLDAKVIADPETGTPLVIPLEPPTASNASVAELHRSSGSTPH